MMRFAVHPAVFLGGALLLSGLLLWLRPSATVERPAAQRGDHRPARAQRAEVALDTAVLERYIGFYDVASTLRVDVTLENGRLVLHVPDSARLELLAESETRFYVEGGAIEIAFEVDGPNEIKGFVAHLPNGDLTAVRVRR
jgi:hypothetical protein